MLKIFHPWTCCRIQSHYRKYWLHNILLILLFYRRILHVYGDQHRGVEDLLSNILDPNLAINPNYLSFTAETTSGEIETGLLQSDTPDTVVLLQAMNKQVTLSRKQLKRFETSGLSLMPEGLEAGLTPAELRDLIAFVQAQP